MTFGFGFCSVLYRVGFGPGRVLMIIIIIIAVFTGRHVIAQFAITINSNDCLHIWVLNTLMRESYA